MDRSGTATVPSRPSAQSFGAFLRSPSQSKGVEDPSDFSSVLRCLGDAGIKNGPVVRIVNQMEYTTDLEFQHSGSFSLQETPS
jgi:hypothetical protein